MVKYSEGEGGILKKLLMNAIVVIFAFIIGGVVVSYEEDYGILTAAEPEFTAPPTPRTQLDTSNKLNINTATKEELIKLYGIGKVLSERIIDYREENGKFYVIEDIMKVKGINIDTFNGIKDFIYAE